ncbi:hypothetical protein L2E82_16259 [Cichorium intybus]|uniref:Uncharacterized protein n=1 Tax=Cichorium intybus TaxID=13427 RepID=A0ACB9F509_CICIN|nr:hypothetical protein L2E82_16259 [Cichorium intybus]
MAETIPFKNLHSREYEYHGRKKKVHSETWNCIGKNLGSSSVDQTVRVWHIEPYGHVTEWDSCGKCSQQAELCKKNSNVTYKLDGTHVTVGNQVQFPFTM